LTLLRLTFVLEYTWCSLKSALKGKGELGRCKDFHCILVLVYSLPSSYLCSPCLFALNWHFWWGNGVKGANNDPVLVLNAKEGEIKAKANGSATLVNLKNNRVRIFDLSKVLLLQNLVSCGGEFWLWEKREFLALDQFYSWNNSLCAQTSVFDLEIGKWIWFAKQNKRWQRAIQICQIIVKNNLVFNCIDVALLLVDFGCVGINHQKGGDWKGNVPLGNFYNILVIKCPTHLIKF
jgi:hypothetical protein